MCTASCCRSLLRLCCAWRALCCARTGADVLVLIDGEARGPTTVSADAPKLSIRQSECTDVPPGSRHTCYHQRMLGKCDAAFMVRYAYCSQTCGRAPCPACEDKQPGE